MRPYVAGGHDDVLGERAVTVHADAHAIGAQHPPARHAVAALAAHDVALGADQLALVDRLHALAELGHLPHELVPDHQRRVDGRLCPFVPGLDVQVGATDAGAQDADQDLAGSRLRLRHVPQP